MRASYYREINVPWAQAVRQQRQPHVSTPHRGNNEKKCVRTRNKPKNVWEEKVSRDKNERRKDRRDTKRRNRYSNRTTIYRYTEFGQALKEKQDTWGHINYYDTIRSIISCLALLRSHNHVQDEVNDAIEVISAPSRPTTDTWASPTGNRSVPVEQSDNQRCDQTSSNRSFRPQFRTAGKASLVVLDTSFRLGDDYQAPCAEAPALHSRFPWECFFKY